MPLTFSDKRFQSILIILIMVTVALAGLLLLMSYLAASSVAVANPPAPPEEVAVQPETITPAVDNGDDVTATVNDTIITRQAWQQATRLDGVMSRLAGQPIPTAEETLDRLINEIIVLAGVPASPQPPMDEVEARIVALETSWNVADEAVVAALAEAGLERTALSERVRRLIRVEAALNQLAARHDDLDAWLAEARASAEIGLYHSLVSSSQKLDLPEASVATRQLPASTSQSSANLSSLTSQNALPPELPVGPYVENIAPDFSLPQLNGELLSLSNFKGKPVIINFWASWCPPCRRELPALQAAYASYSDKTGFVAVNVKEEAGAVSAFATEMGLTFPVALDADGMVSDAAYEVRGLPTTLFVDARGVVAARHVGPLNEALIDSYLAPLLTPEDPAISEGQAQSSVIPGEQMQPQTSLNADGDNPSTTVAHSLAGSLAPDFALATAGGASISLQDYRDKSNVVLVFYRGHT